MPELTSVELVNSVLSIVQIANEDVTRVPDIHLISLRLTRHHVQSRVPEQCKSR